MSMERVTAPVVRKLEAMPLTRRLVVILLTLLLAALMATSLTTARLVQRDLKANVDDQLRAVARPIAEDDAAVTVGGDSGDIYNHTTSTDPTNYFFVRQPSDGSAWQYRFPTGEASRPRRPGAPARRPTGARRSTLHRAIPRRQHALALHRRPLHRPPTTPPSPWACR
ncbi:hypothetical protein LP422_02660 [Janibacter limosus]|uniref:Uncharacterized protein n=1 Tax=Janibacter limosus TaxID=53458 RepID=A0AC61U596_9MICO|nr:hypothetical protein [Janibacter limosus]UUZ45191.1 hypothetical protein LP422_02660 [Janibacter limosus]